MLFWLLFLVSSVLFSFVLNRNLCVHIILILLLLFKLYFGVIFKGLLEGLQYASLIYWNLHLSDTDNSNSKFAPKELHFLFSFCLIIFMYINEMIYKFNNKVL